MMPNFLFISVKPQFASKIVDGEKSIELRKSKPKVGQGDYILIYATKPFMKVVGFAKIEQIIDTNPQKMWDSYSEKLGINKLDYDNYFNNSNRAIGIQISSVCKFKKGFLLSDIKKIMPTFSPPQTYLYFSKFQILRNFIRLSN